MQHLLPAARLAYPCPVPRIRLLPDTVINRIAAGEVVERPASVVKELVENALDAGARTVTVRLVEGGLQSVEVNDDGTGMDADDALLALERHATSKLFDDNGLIAISTLGFRGEALPSIAAVSRLVLETATEDGPGTRVECEFGQVRGVRPTARARGTRVEVTDLFARLPARRKFLRSRDTELRHAVTLLTSLALTRPAIAFALFHNDRSVLSLPPAGSLVARLPDILGTRLAARAVPIAACRGSWQVSGYLVPARAAGSLSLAVNGRVVRDRLLIAAAHRVLRGASGALAAEGFIHVELPAAEVDVNVHPTKAEVRFRNPAAIASFLTEALAAVLPRLSGPTEVRRLVTPSASPPAAPVLPFTYPSPPSPPTAAEALPTGRDSSPPVTPLGRLVGQYRGTYLVVEDAEGLLLIDQHVAHERVLYEELLARDESLPLQPLLLPVVVELRADHAALAAELAPQLASLGLEVEPLSGTSVRITAAPPDFPTASLTTLLPALLSDLESGATPGDTLRQRAAAALACRAAMKKNSPLTPAEAAHLLARLARVRDPHRCPHGRPIALRLPHAEIERRIGRA